MSEPPQTAVLVKPVATPLPASASAAKRPTDRPRLVEGQPRDGVDKDTFKNPFEALTRPGVNAPQGRRQNIGLVARPAADTTARPGGIGGDLIQDFRERVRAASKHLKGAALETPTVPGVAASADLGGEAADDMSQTIAEVAPAMGMPSGRGPRYAPRPQDMLEQLDARVRRQAGPVTAPQRAPRWRIVNAAPPPPERWSDGVDSALQAMPLTDRIHATKTGDVARAAQIDPVLLALGFVVPDAQVSPIGDTLPLPAAVAASPEVAALSASVPTKPAVRVADELPLPLADIPAPPKGPPLLPVPLTSDSIPIDIDDLLSLHPLADESPDESLALDVTIRRQSSAPPPAQAPVAAGPQPWLPPIIVPRASGAPADALGDEDFPADPSWSGAEDSALISANDDAYLLGDPDDDFGLDDDLTPADQGRARARGGWLWAASFALVTGAGGFAGWMLNSAQPTSPVTVSASVSLLPQPEPVPGGVTDGAPDSAPLAVGASALVTSQAADAPGQVADPALITDPSQIIDLAALPPSPLPDAAPSDEASPITDLITQGRFSEARAAIHAARVERPNDATLKRQLQDTLRLDPAFAPDTVTLGTTDISEIRRLGGGSTLTFKLRQGDALTAFKPLQTRRQSNYRSEIAAWRLCELIGCGFQIPYNRPVRISHADFDKLYDTSDPKQRAYAKGFKDLQWQQADGQTFLYGTQKAWVPSFTQFPIEDTDTWQPWLAQRDRKKTLDRTLQENLRRWLRDDATSRAYRPVLNEAGDATTPAIARQLSDMLTFDFLVGNWDRFSTVRSYWGANCQIGSGHLISIDNGASFPITPAGRVEANLMKVERFSPSLIQALRDLDHDHTLAALFPDPTAQDLKRFAQFWKQRERLLARVDGLISKHGADAVLRFE
jgi:hypothetical protein